METLPGEDSTAWIAWNQPLGKPRAAGQVASGIQPSILDTLV